MIVKHSREPSLVRHKTGRYDTTILTDAGGVYGKHSVKCKQWLVNLPFLKILKLLKPCIISRTNQIFVLQNNAIDCPSYLKVLSE